MPRVTVLGVTLPVPRWSVGGFGVLALAAVAVLVYRQAVPVGTSVVTLRQANDALAEEVAEYGLHIGEQPKQVVEDPDGQLRVHVYRDHCVLIQRFGARTVSRLVPDLLRHQPSAHAAVVPSLVARVFAAGGRCVAGQHPGRFVWHYGSRDGCWVEVWRRYEDGCEQVQMLHACSGTWDTNQDGTPRVRWTSCVH